MELNPKRSHWFQWWFHQYDSQENASFPELLASLPSNSCAPHVIQKAPKKMDDVDLQFEDNLQALTARSLQRKSTSRSRRPEKAARKEQTYVLAEMV
jgi:hypothetical protein